MKTKNSSIRIERISPSEAEEVAKFVFEDAIYDEPMCNSIDLEKSPSFDYYVKKAVAQGISFKAIDTENGNKIVGLRLHTLNRKEDPVEHLDQDDPFDGIALFLDKALEKCDLFNKYNVDCFIEGKLLSVRRGYRGRGIAGMMMEATMDFMRENKIPLIYIPCSSIYTVRVLEKLDFENIYKIYYKDYKIDGQIPFVPKEPHLYFTSCAKVVV